MNELGRKYNDINYLKNKKGNYIMNNNNNINNKNNYLKEI